MEKYMNSFLDAMVSCKMLTKETFDMWNERFTTVLDPNIAPWDPWLAQEWNKKPRNTFADLADFYNDDAWVCQQVRMLNAWTIEEVPLKSFLKPGLNVLDFGCGHGRDGLGCAQAGANVTFTDISPRLLAGVQAFCKAHDVVASTYLIEEEVPQVPGQYDIIICKDVLEHVKRPIELLEVLLKSLSVGGIMWMTVFFNGHELSPYHLPEHYHLDDPRKWSNICKNYGLELIDGTDRFYRKVK